MTLLVRDEADIVDAQVAFHLNAGVDFVVATDNGSVDETVEILRAYERDGYLHLISNPDRGFSQIEVVTGMARLAATDFGADWVINSDADEFWWPRGGSLKDVLENVPGRFGCVRCLLRDFVPRPGGAEPFAERMIVRLCDKTFPYSPHFKTAHRADPEVRVGGGNHEAFGARLLPLRQAYPIDVLHFPVRALEQCARKYLRWRALQVRAGQVPAPEPAAAYDAHRQGRMQEFYDSLVVAGSRLEDGLAAGTYHIDTRLRDALRSLHAAEPGGHRPLALPPAAPKLVFDSDVDAGYVLEVGQLGDVDDLARLSQRVERLDARVSRCEPSLGARLRSLFASR